MLGLVDPGVMIACFGHGVDGRHDGELRYDILPNAMSVHSSASRF